MALVQKANIHNDTYGGLLYLLEELSDALERYVHNSNMALIKGLTDEIEAEIKHREEERVQAVPRIKARIEQLVPYERQAKCQEICARIGKGIEEDVKKAKHLPLIFSSTRKKTGNPANASTAKSIRKAPF